MVSLNICSIAYRSAAMLKKAGILLSSTLLVRVDCGRFLNAEPIAGLLLGNGHFGYQGL